MKLSARNRIPAKVVRITHGEAIANVELDANGQRLVSSITVEAVNGPGALRGLRGLCCRQGVGRDDRARGLARAVKVQPWGQRLG